MRSATGSADAVARADNKRLVRELTDVPLRQGHEGILQMVEGAWTAFPDYHEELHELIAEGDRVVVHLTISGTQRGQWGPLAPTGKRVQFGD